MALFFHCLQCRRASPGTALGLPGRETLAHVERRLWYGCEGGSREGGVAKTKGWRMLYGCTFLERPISFFSQIHTTPRLSLPRQPGRGSLLPCPPPCHGNAACTRVWLCGVCVCGERCGRANRHFRSNSPSDERGEEVAAEIMMMPLCLSFD